MKLLTFKLQLTIEKVKGEFSQLIAI